MNETYTLSARRNDRFVDHSGKRVGRLTVVRYLGMNEKKKPKWLCLCDCGSEAHISPSSIVRGDTTSCGCAHAEMLRKRNTTHGLSRTPTHMSWLHLNNRCYNPKNNRFPDYGARGITVCDRWRHDFSAFLEDMGPRPSKAHSIDRIDGSLGYRPDNCKWSTSTEQGRNKRNNRVWTHEGFSRTVSEWAEILGMKRTILKDRFLAGWPIEKILTTPKATNRK